MIHDNGLSLGVSTYGGNKPWVYEDARGKRECRLSPSPISTQRCLIVEQAACCNPRIHFVIKEFDLESAWLVACHDYGVTGEIITVNNQHLTRKREVPNRIRPGRAEQLADLGCMRAACEGLGHQPSQVRINVNVQALRVEYRSSWFDFFRNEPRTRRTAVDHVTVEISADASDDVPALIERITGLSNIVPSYHVGEVNDDTSVHRVPSAYLDVSDDDRLLESRRAGSQALDIWV